MCRWFCGRNFHPSQGHGSYHERENEFRSRPDEKELCRRGKRKEGTTRSSIDFFFFFAVYCNLICLYSSPLNLRLLINATGNGFATLVDT
jgi:hypothetical protein